MSCGPDLRFGELTESRAEVALAWSDAAWFQEVVATLHGPHCKFARTLPVEFSFDATTTSDGPFVTRTVVTEPCYWTAELPFLYNLEVAWKTARDARCRFSAKIGLRRWASRGQSFYTNGQRTVLRGAIAQALDIEMLEAGRAVDAALLVSPPDVEAWRFADEHGVPLVTDLRGESGGIRSVLAGLSWRPAAVLAIVDEHQLTPKSIQNLPTHLALTLGLEHGGHSYPNVDLWRKKAALPDWASAVAVDLDSNERPAPWLAHCGKPVIAIRRGGAYADLHQARAACDRLQAELAPEFDLAGYFV